MRRTSKIALGVFATVVVLLAGCGQRVLNEEPMGLEPGESRARTVENLGKGWKVNVETSSPGVPVGVYLVLGKDREAAMQALQKEKPPGTELVLDSEASTEGKTLAVTMPDKGDLAILVSNPVANRKKAEVKIKVYRP